MNKLFSTRWILSAAVAAVPLMALAPAADAQYRIAQDGRALDASNRIGSGGRNPNDSSARAPDAVTGNDIVTGNVTGGRQFRGSVPYRDPTAFRGRSAGIELDNFVRQSSGPDERLAEVSVPFYGAGRGVAPPPGYVTAGPGSGGYVPEGMTVNRPVSDQRMGNVNYGQQDLTLPAPGQLLLPGPVDPSAGQQYITASPLTGIRQVGVNDPNFGTSITNTQYNPQTGRLDSTQIDRMRAELNAAAGAGDLTNPTAPGTENARSGADPRNADPKNAGGPPQNQNATTPGGARPIEQQPVQQPVGPGAVAIAQKPLNVAIAQNANDMSTQQGVRQRLTAPPQAQSSVYAELLKRHEESTIDPNVSDVDASRDFNAAKRALDQKTASTPGGPPGAPGAAPGRPGAAPGQPGAITPPNIPAPVTPAAPGAAPTPPPEPTVAPGVPDYAKRNQALLKNGVPDPKKKIHKAEPVKVPSLGKGVKGKGLAELMQSAESMMKDGKFTSALDQYDQAEQVAPNNPLIRLGRANAELGASYYARAETHLREVFTKNPELLVGQYDLTSWLGETRLQVLVNDLKEISSREKNEARPVFLLAYIAYNTGHEQNADAYLDLADKRSGGKDQFFKLLRDNWALPEKPAAPGAAAPETPAPAPASAAPATPAPEQNK
jgi:tetratricopeptide (TPR) repeat protein